MGRAAQIIINVKGRYRCVVFRDAERECTRCRGKVVVTIFSPHKPPPRNGLFDPRLYMLNDDE